MEKLIHKLTDQDRQSPTYRYLASITSTVILTAVIWIAFVANTDHTLDVEKWLTSDSHWLAIVGISFMLMFVCALTPLPAEAVTVANGIVFGPVFGTVLTWMSAMASAAFIFLYGRHLLQRTRLNWSEHKQINNVETWMHKWGNQGFLLARLVPVIPFFALNIGAVFLPVTARNYMILTGIGILPHICIICFLSGQHTLH